MSGNFTVIFADGVTGYVSAVKVTDTYEGYLELSSFSAVTHHFLSEHEERKALIESGRLKGYYRFEPELLDEVRRESEWTENTR